MRRPLFLAVWLALVGRLGAVEALLEVDHASSRLEAEVASSLETFTGQFAAFDARLAVNPAQRRVVRAQVHVRLADFRTGDEKRDRELHGWQDSAQFPECVFTLVALEPAAGTAAQFTARGELIFHGTTRALVFPVAIAVSPDGHYTIGGELPLDTREFGLPVIRKFGVFKVDPVVKVRFRLQGRRPAK